MRYKAFTKCLHGIWRGVCKVIARCYPHLCKVFANDFARYCEVLVMSCKVLQCVARCFHVSSKSSEFVAFALHGVCNRFEFNLPGVCKVVAEPSQVCVSRGFEQCLHVFAGTTLHPLCKYLAHLANELANTLQVPCETSAQILQTPCKHF